MTNNERAQMDTHKLKSDLNEFGHLVLCTEQVDGQALVTQLANTGEHKMVSVFGNGYMNTMHYCHSWLNQDLVLLNRWPERNLGAQALVVITGAFDNEETLGRFLMATKRGHKVIVEGKRGPHFHSEDWAEYRLNYVITTREINGTE